MSTSSSYDSMGDLYLRAALVNDGKMDSEELYEGYGAPDQVTWVEPAPPAAAPAAEPKSTSDSVAAQAAAGPAPSFMDDEAYRAAVEAKERSEAVVAQSTPLLNLSSGGIQAGANYGNDSALYTDASLQASNDRAKVEAMEIGGVADANYARAEYEPSPVYDPYVDYKRYSEDLA
jgi:hypothetical protein